MFRRLFAVLAGTAVALSVCAAPASAGFVSLRDLMNGFDPLQYWVLDDAGPPGLNQVAGEPPISTAGVGPAITWHTNAHPFAGREPFSVRLNASGPRSGQYLRSAIAPGTRGIPDEDTQTGTIVIWFRLPKALRTWTQVLAVDNGAWSGTGGGLMINTRGHLVSEDVSGFVDFRSKRTLNDLKWHMVAWSDTYTPGPGGTGSTLYLDGVQLTDSLVALWVPRLGVTGSRLLLGDGGRNEVKGIGRLHGNIGNVAIYDSPMGADEIGDIYTAGTILDQAPVGASQSVSTNEDSPLLVTLSANDADGDALTFSIDGGPDHGALNSLSPTDCTTTPGTCTTTVTYTPNSDFNGADSFTFTANDGLADSAAAEVSITVNPVKDAVSSTNESISADGRYVAFQAAPGGISQVFVHDRQLGGLETVSVSNDGTEGNSGSSDAMISADGRYVVFRSNANNLVAGDTNGVPDVFVHDRQTGVTTRVSVASDGSQGDGSSGGEGNGISGDGRFVVFWSAATNLVAGDTNGIEDVFVRDSESGATTRASVATGGGQQTGSLGNLERAASISADGRYVAFVSLASDLVAGDTNGWADVFVHDRQSGTTTRQSVSSGGDQGNEHSFAPTLSADGRYVTFMSSASNLVPGDANPCVPPSGGCSVPTWIDVFVRDMQTNTTTLVSKATDGTQANYVPNGLCDREVAISADGRFVAFCSTSTNLVTGDTNEMGDIFVHDRQTSETTRVSVATDGTQTDDFSFDPAMSSDGRYVAFWSWSGALADGDTLARSPDVFLRDRQTSETKRISDFW